MNYQTTKPKAYLGMNAIPALLICIWIAGITILATLGELSDNHYGSREISILASLSELIVWFWVTQKMTREEIMSEWLQAFVMITYCLMLIQDLISIFNDGFYIIAAVGLICLLAKNVILIIKYSGAISRFAIAESIFIILTMFLVADKTGDSLFSSKRLWILLIVLQYEFLRRMLKEEEEDEDDEDEDDDEEFEEEE